MAEYIEREAVLAKCREIAACEWNHRASPVSWADAYEQFAEDVEEITVADVAPIRHGRWVKRGDKWQCTHCKVLMSIAGTPKENMLNYCPNCGAKMDG